jgi:hypothetical protein
MSVASKRAAKPKAEAKADRAIAFRAPDEIHGALKQIAGRLEMSKIQIDGRVPYERDILIWLVSDLWMEGPEKWASRLTKAHDNHKKFVPTAAN